MSPLALAVGFVTVPVMVTSPLPLSWSQNSYAPLPGEVIAEAVNAGVAADAIAGAPATANSTPERTVSAAVKRLIPADSVPRAWGGGNRH